MDKISCLFAIITLGYLVGRIRLRSLSFGASGVIFVALAAGHLGWQIPEGIGSLGLVLFIYCLGISAGPGFLRTFGQQGRALVVLGTVLVATAVAATWLTARWFAVPPDLAAGVFAGAMTSTPALAAVSEVLPPDSHVAVGFGVAYPVGVIGVVLFVQLIPRLFGVSLSQLGQASAPGLPSNDIQRVLLVVRNPGVVGRRLSQLEAVERSSCQITRVLRGNELVPIPATFTLDLDQHLLAVGPASDVQLVVDMLGARSDRTGFVLETERHRARVVVTSAGVVGKSLKQLQLLSRFGITVARITRHDVEFVPRPGEVLQFGDSLQLVGEPEDLERFATHAGHRARTLDETDVISLAAGILAGVLLGQVGLQLGSQTLSLGLAGGPLVVGLWLGHWGRIGPLVGHFPRASRMLLTDIGLVFFLAEAGVNAGAGLAPVLARQGPSLLLAAGFIAAAPMAAGLAVGRFWWKLSWLQVLGVVCGGMTSTPGLGAITSQTDSDIPVVSYAAVYPAALVLLTILSRTLVGLLQHG